MLLVCHVPSFGCHVNMRKWLLICILVAIAWSHRGPHLVGYKAGDEIVIQCKDHEGKWGKGPVCIQNNKELKFKYGTEENFHCGWAVGDTEMYEHLTKLVLQDGKLSMHT